jgi:hypothetical protein
LIQLWIVLLKRLQRERFAGDSSGTTWISPDGDIERWPGNWRGKLADITKNSFKVG